MGKYSIRIWSSEACEKWLSLNNANVYVHAGRCVLHVCLWVDGAHACACVCEKAQVYKSHYHIQPW